MRVLWLGLLMFVLCLGCISAEEARRTAVENNFNQIEKDQVEEAIKNYEQDLESPQSEFTHVIATETEYYNNGPQQSRPPDGKFPTGTKVRIVEEAGSYVRVRSENGIEAYVASNAVKQKEDSATDVSGIVEGGNKFALDLYQRLRPEEGNLFYSPSSISTAMAMTYAGAAGNTKSEMANALHFQMPDAQLHTGMKTLQTYWTTPDKKKGVRLNLANRLWGQQGYEFLPAFLKVTRDNYDAELVRLDFAQSEQARQTINDWVEQQTEEKITDLIPAGVLNLDTRLVLTNAVYFKGSWSKQFKVGDTKEDEFHLTSSKRIKVPLMHRWDEYRYAEIDDLQLLELPYGDGSLSMVVLLPKKIDGLAGLETKLTFQNLQHWIGSLKRRDVKVYLPKFKTTSQFNLGNTLKTMGMKLAFDPITADFSSMAVERNLFISAAVHKAFVDVNEEGTEAAAATGVVLKAVSKQIPSVFRADHPFVFMIRDNRNGAILFMGRIRNPLE